MKPLEEEDKLPVPNISDRLREFASQRSFRKVDESSSLGAIAWESLNNN